MQTIRCQCGKIVCEIQNMPVTPRIESKPLTGTGPAAVIMCRHCKRYVILRVPAIASVGYANEVREGA